MKITKEQLKAIIKEEIERALTEEEDFMQDAAEDTKEKGHEGIFKKWCKDPEQGFEGVNQSCVDKAYKVGAPWKARATLAVTYSRAKGGAKSLEYPEDSDKNKKD